MSRKRSRGILIAVVLITLIGVAGTRLYLVRELLAAFLIFCALLSAFAIAILVSFILIKGIVRCFELLAGRASGALAVRHESATIDSIR
jgi:hypothetical protein